MRTLFSSAAFAGSKRGFVFKLGEDGRLGYHRDYGKLLNREAEENA